MSTVAGTARVSRRRRGALAAASIAAAVSLLVPVVPAEAASRPITPESVGIQDDWLRANDPAAWGSARMYAKWCRVQPTGSTDATEGAMRALGTAFGIHRDMGVTRLSVSLGHPAPWVFEDHPAAFARSNMRIWFCSGRAAGGSFPTTSSLRSGRVRDAYIAYVRGVIDAARIYLDGDPANRIVLQAWNEPNLLNGGAITKKIPGAARTYRDAAKSLREQERIMRDVAQSMIPGRFEISSPSMYGKKTKLGTQYWRYQSKKRTIDSISLNFYTLRRKSVNNSLSQWKQKAGRAKRVVTRYKKLRRLPIWLTETNHNLTNVGNSQANVTGFWADPAAQKRMVEVTTMEALRKGFAGIQWYQGWAAQTAVNVQAGTPAMEASKALMAELVGRRIVRCRTKRSITTCTLSARTDSGRIRISWSRKGSKGVTILR